MNLSLLEPGKTPNEVKRNAEELDCWRQMRLKQQEKLCEFPPREHIEALLLPALAITLCSSSLSLRS